MAFKHPTGGSPKKLAIIGLGPTSQDWHSAHVQYDPPVPVVDEVWTVNKGFRTVNCDLCFIMDDLVDESRKSNRYANEIVKVSKKMPIFTTTVDAPVKERWPHVLKYPLNEVLMFWGRHVSKRRGLGEISDAQALETGIAEYGYMHNSVPYMMAYAGYIGIEELFLFGVDYDFPGSAVHESDKPNAEWWASALISGLGVKTKMSSRTTFMSKNRQLWFYGFNGRQPF